MGEAAGIGGQLGWKAESVFKTYVAPTKGQPFTDEQIVRENNYQRTKSIAAGRLAMRDLDHAKTTYDAKGPINGDFLGSGMGPILNLLHGNVVTPALITTGVYQQTHNVGLVGPNGKSLSLQVGRPDVSGTVRAFSYSGGKLGQFVLKLDANGVLQWSGSFDFAKEDTAQALATLAYDAAAGTLGFQGATVEFDDVVLTDCMTNYELTIGVPLATGRFCIGGGAEKKEQVLNDQITASLKTTMEFSSLSLHTAFVNATRRKVELNHEGVALTGSHNQQLLVTMASMVPVSSGPVIQGPDIVTQDVTFEALITASNPLAQFLYKTSEPAL